MTPQTAVLEPPTTTRSPEEAPSPFRWAVLATSCFSVIAFQVAAMAYSPLLGDISRDLRITLAQSVNLMTVYMLFAAISYFIAGPMVDRMGPAKLLTTSALLSAAPATLLLLVGQSYPAILVLRALQGCAIGFAMPSMAPLVLQWFRPQQRGLALGIGGACIPVATMASVLASPALFRATGNWQVSVAWLSATGWFAVIYCLVVFQIAKSKTPSTRLQAGDPSGSIFRAAMSSPYTWVGVVAAFATNWIMQSAFGLSPSYFAEPKPVGLGLGPMAAGQLMGVVQIGAIVGPIVGGLLLDKVFRQKPRIVLAIGFLLVFAYFGMQSEAVFNDRPLFFAALALWGAGLGMLFPMLQSLINELYDHAIVGKMNGIWLGIGAFGGSAGLMANSFALKQTGNYLLTINIIAGAAVVGLLLCAIRPRLAASR